MSASVLWGLMVLNVQGGAISMPWTFYGEAACRTAAKAVQEGYSFRAVCVPLDKGAKP